MSKNKKPRPRRDDGLDDMGEYWRDVKEASKEHKARVMPDRIAEIRALEGQGYTVRELNPGVQYRINGKLDLYPVHRRWHFIPANSRGRYVKVEHIVGRKLGLERGPR